MPTERDIGEWLRNYGFSQGIRLEMNNGQCVLVDHNNREAMVIELPPTSSIMMLHCQLAPLERHVANDVLYRLLALNFDTDAMRGCWIALDEQYTLRLCNQQPLAGLEQAAFISTLEGFIQQGIEVQEYVVKEMI